MDAQALLNRMAAAGLSVTASGGRLQIQPADKLTADLHAQVVALKPELLALLAAPLSDDKPPAAKVEILVAEKVTPPPPKVSGQTAKKGAVDPASRKERRLQQQRQRRATRQRIDYYPSPAAIKALDALRQQSSGNASTIIDRVLVGIEVESPEARA